MRKSLGKKEKEEKEAEDGIPTPSYEATYDPPAGVKCLDPVERANGCV
jgi:hypothetical protein